MSFTLEKMEAELFAIEEAMLKIHSVDGHAEAKAMSSSFLHIFTWKLLLLRPFVADISASS